MLCLTFSATFHVSSHFYRTVVFCGAAFPCNCHVSIIEGLYGGDVLRFAVLAFCCVGVLMCYVLLCWCFAVFGVLLCWCFDVLRFAVLVF